MAAFDFPNSPSNGDTYSANGIDWIYNGSVWKKDATAGVKGQKGEVGQKGQKGEKGEVGDKGQKGEDNSTKGQKGEIGATGGTGGTGQKGQKGQKGEDNSTKGQKGEIGNTGGTGGTGAQGDKGQKGEIGVTGTVFTSGTRMLFHQASAPTGWTKSTTNNDRALRVVSGTSGGTQGGDYSFSSRLNSTVTTANGSVSSHTLTESQIPSHYHYAFRSGNAGQLRNGSNMNSNNYPGSGTGPGNLYETYNITARNEIPDVGRTSSVGSNSGHSHGFANPNFNLGVRYTDVIIAQKN